MKLKDKILVLGISMCVMLIGLVTVSLTIPSEKEKAGTADKKQETKATVKPSVDADGLSYVLEYNAYPEVNNLIENYFKAQTECDVEKLEELVSEISYIYIKEDVLKAQAKIIESYDNIDCYTIKGGISGTYVVYVYYEAKLVGIEERAPGLMRLYVSQTDNGSLRVFLNDVDEDVQNFIDKSAKTDEVVKLVQTVNQKFEEAIAKSEDLRIYYAELEEQTQAAAPTDEPHENTEAVNE